MIIFKEFYAKSLPNGKFISPSEQVNDFISQSNIEYVDARYCISTGNVEVPCILLIYKEKGDE